MYRTLPGVSISYLHDAAGNVIGGEFTTGYWNAFIDFNGRLLADYESDGAHFSHENALGSTNQTTDWTGTQSQDVTFYPWGQVWNRTSGYNVHQEFASLPDYDSDMDQYQTPTRMYPPILGRWFTPDPDNAGADVSNPQSWNAYSYAGNSPINGIDPERASADR